MQKAHALPGGGGASMHLGQVVHVWVDVSAPEAKGEECCGNAVGRLP